ncbi:hypothetical protein H0H93_008071 [Arthromyces matolae]|nr:hypothetical protein H0H93_008071 [Arthromyces matolae]
MKGSLPLVQVGAVFCLPVLAQAASTVTLYGLSASNTQDFEIFGSTTIYAIGSGTDGMTTYVEEFVETMAVESFLYPTTVTSDGVVQTLYPTTTTTITPPTPVTLTGTLAADATHYVYHNDPTPTKSLSEGEYWITLEQECTLDDKGGESCVVESWDVKNSSTYSAYTTTKTGSAVPLYTLVVADSSAKGNGAAFGARLGNDFFVASASSAVALISVWALFL